MCMFVYLCTKLVRSFTKKNLQIHKIFIWSLFCFCTAKKLWYKWLLAALIPCTTELCLNGRFTTLLMHRFLSEQEINQPFPAFVFQTPMSSAIFSWQRWRFGEMPKGRRKRPHKHSLSDDFSLVINFSPTVCHPDLKHHGLEVLV